MMSDQDVTLRRKSAPVVAGLLTECAPTALLVGARCRTCRTLYFPKVRGCRNPACTDGLLVEETLPETGVLYSFTIQHYQPPPLFRMDDWQPYGLGLLAFEGGLRVMGMLEGIALDELRIGQLFSVGARPLYTDEHSVERWTHVFCYSGEGTNS